jgi:hypothetical protein
VNLGGGMAACLPLEPGRMTPHRAAVLLAEGRRVESPARPQM